MKLSRSRLSDASVLRSKVIFESALNVPSALSWNVPVPPVAVRTASEGSETPTSCSRTLTVALDAAVTAQALPLAVVAAVGDAVAGAGVAVGVDVAVGVSVDALVTVAAPPQATSATVVIERRR